MTAFWLIDKALSKVNTAIKRGVLVRPDTCEGCGAKPTPTTYQREGRTIQRSSIEAHHWNGHHNALDVLFLCRDCNTLLRGDKFHSGNLSKAETIEYIKSRQSQP